MTKILWCLFCSFHWVAGVVIIIPISQIRKPRLSHSEQAELGIETYVCVLNHVLPFSL